MFLMNSAIVVTSFMRSHVVFKFLNYVTDKIVRVLLITLVLMLLRCVVKERPRAGERVTLGYVLSVHNKR